MRTLILFMKKTSQKVGLMAPVIICLLFIQASKVAAQTNRYSEYLEIQSNAEVNAQIMLNNVHSNVEFHRLHPTAADLEAMSNAMLHWKPPQPWSDAAKRQETLEHCAEVLRSAIDTNQIEIACGKLTNQPEAVIALKEISSEAISNLNEVANLLTNSNLITSLGEAGYQAGITTPTNDFRFGFWSENQLPTLIRDVDIRTPDAQQVLVSASFYESGKLRFLRINSPDSKGILRNKMQLGFNEDGTLNLHWMRPADKKS